MSTLEDDLRELSDLLPGLPGEASTASHSAAALVAATAPMRAEIAALRDVAHESATVASQLGQAFARHAHDLEQQLRDAMNGATASWDKARHAIEEGADETFASALGLFQERTALQSSLAGATITLHEIDTAGDGAAQAMQRAAGGAGHALHDVSASIHTEAQGVHGMLADFVPRINAATDALQTRVGELREKFGHAADALREGLLHRAQELDQALQETFGALTAELTDQLGLTSDHLHGGVGKPLAEAGDTAREALVALGNSATEGDRKLIEARAVFAQALAELDETARRIPETIREIHAAFEKIDGM